jgi:hypothetical protein
MSEKWKRGLPEVVECYACFTALDSNEPPIYMAGCWRCYLREWERNSTLDVCGAQTSKGKTDE